VGHGVEAGDDRHKRAGVLRRRRIWRQDRKPHADRALELFGLTEPEKRWLAAYHTRVRDTFTHCFDAQTTRWLANIVDAYVTMAP
jgi:hypothetical protein